MRVNESEDYKSSNNYVELEGFVNTLPEFHHQTYGEGIYSFIIKVSRLNNEVFDYLRVEVSERLINIQSISIGDGIRVSGQFRSFNKRDKESGRTSLELSVFAKEFEFVENVRSENIIKLEGFICKEPTYRVTPKGREICDLLVAVNRNYNKSDYIPCITWGRNAKFSSNLAVGSGISLEGRIQSRIYKKRVGEDTFEDRVAYEVSVSKISVFEDMNNTQE